MDMPTDEEVRFGAALNRAHIRMGRENGDVARLEAYLARVPVEKRPPDWETHAASISAQRDLAQAALDEAYRKLPASPNYGLSILTSMLRARLAHSGTLDWLATVERLGGPKARIVLARVRELERQADDIDYVVDEACPVVQAMRVHDQHPAEFRRRPAQRVRVA